MSKKLPFFQWYPADADTDENFRAMNDSEIGFYLRCLNHAWRNDGIPADPEMRARVLRDKREYADKQWKIVGRCFVPDPEHPDRLVNPRQYEELQKASRKSSVNADAANARWEKARAMRSHMRSHENGSANAVVRASDSDSASVSASEKKNPISEDFEIWFERQFARHPKKRARTPAERTAATAFAAGEFTLEACEEVHKAWCSTEAWKWKSGARAPTYGEWITDKGFRYPPPEEDGEAAWRKAAESA